MTNLLILLSLPEPIRNQYRDRLQAAFPQLKIAVVDHRSKVGPYIGTTDALVTFTPMMADEVVRDAPRLRWIQTLGTGVDNLVDLPSLGKNVVVTNIHGIHGAPVSEAALAAMLALARGLPRSVRAQDRGEWSRWPPPQLLDKKTVGIFGIGIIAEALAPKCKALGMTVVGITSEKRPVAGFDSVYGRDELKKAVGEFDFFVLLTPLTPQTRGIIDTGVFTAMKPTSYLINVARGGVVDEAALLEALRSERIAGAAIDVFVEEPLPPNHPFWSCKNALVTPHLGGYCDAYVDLAFPTLLTNMRCFLDGNIDGMVHVVKRPAH